jgi:MFS superfamily sulfate permease-like transporter
MTAQLLRPFSRETFARDFTASIVVFLVAMPLCMGIAVASGVPPEKGLITGMIGGMIVGTLAGSPLQVSGPAAGLAVLVLELVREHGLAALGPILVLAGIIQFAAGVFKLGGWFRAISPAVVHGMLAGIGALIVLQQFHVLFDAKPLRNGPENLAAMPGRLLGLSPTNIAQDELAFVLGLITIAAMLGWEKFRPSSLRLIPGALVGVVTATLVAFFTKVDVARVQVPESIFSAITPPSADSFIASLTQPSVMVTAFAIAFIASCETLLSAAAVDRMHNGVRTNYDKELRAQGVGNLLCGLAGSLPMTGVIVRSSANVQAGALTRASTILHGVWILSFIVLLPWLLLEIPMAALGGILVITGWRLVSLKHVRHLFHNYGVLPAVIWVATFTTVVATDLLTGVLVGIGLSLLEILPILTKARLKVNVRDDGPVREIELDGVAAFVTLPRLTRTLEAVPTDRPLRLNLKNLADIDHTTTEMLVDWLQRIRGGGTLVELLGTPQKLERRIA